MQLQTSKRKQANKNGSGLPGWMADQVRQADLKYKQARFEELAGNLFAAELLRSEAERIYSELESELERRRAGQAGRGA